MTTIGMRIIFQASEPQNSVTPMFSMSCIDRYAPSFVSFCMMLISSIKLATCVGSCFVLWAPSLWSLWEWKMCLVQHDLWHCASIACASPLAMQALYLILSLGSVQDFIALFSACPAFAVLSENSFSLPLSWQKKHQSLSKGRAEDLVKGAEAVSFIVSSALLDLSSTGRSRIWPVPARSAGWIHQQQQQ